MKHPKMESGNFIKEKKEYLLHELQFLFLSTSIQTLC